MQDDTAPDALVEDVFGEELRPGDEVLVLRNGIFRGRVSSLHPFTVTSDDPLNPVTYLDIGPTDVQVLWPRYPLGYYLIADDTAPVDLAPYRERPRIDAVRRTGDGNTVITVNAGAGQVHILLDPTERDRLYADLTYHRKFDDMASRAVDWLADQTEVQR